MKLNDENGRYAAGSFLHPVKVTGGTLSFSDRGKDYHLTSPCLTSLEGKTVLINAAMEIERSGKQIGKATPVKA